MSASASRAQVLASPLPASSLAAAQAGADPAVAQLQATATAATAPSPAPETAPGKGAAPAAPQTAAQAFAAQTQSIPAAQDAIAKAAVPAVAGRPGTVATVAKPAALPTQSPATAGSIGGAVFALVLVVGLILALGWIAKRLPGFRNTGSNGALRVVSSLSLGPRERVVVVAVGETQLLIGVGTGGMRTLHTLEQPLPVAPPAATPAFAQLLAQHFGKKA